MHLHSNRIRTRLHLYCYPSISGY